MKSKRKAYWVNDDGEHCPICKAKLGSCHIGSYCSNKKCHGKWIDGIARLTPYQVKKYKDIIIAPFVFKLDWKKVF